MASAAAAAESIPARHPGTGEPRRLHRLLRLDRLPLALLDRIRAERSQGHTWDEIEQASPQWPEWEQAAPEVLAGFPGRHLPHTSLQRWYDLRVQQVQRERAAQAAATEDFAAELAERRIPNLGAAIKDALGESVLRLAQEGGDEQRLRDELCRLAQVVSALDRDEIARQKLELERRKVVLAEQRAEVDRLLAQRGMSRHDRSQFIEGIINSPAFERYIMEWAGIVMARAAAKAAEKFAAEPAPKEGPTKAAPAPDGQPAPDSEPEASAEPGRDNDSAPAVAPPPPASACERPPSPASGRDLISLLARARDLTAFPPHTRELLSRACGRQSLPPEIPLEREQASWTAEAYARLREAIMAELTDLAAEDECDEPEDGSAQPEA